MLSILEQPHIRTWCKWFFVTKSADHIAQISKLISYNQVSDIKVTSTKVSSPSRWKDEKPLSFTSHKHNFLEIIFFPTSTSFWQPHLLYISICYSLDQKQLHANIRLMPKIPLLAQQWLKEETFRLQNEVNGRNRRKSSFLFMFPNAQLRWLHCKPIADSTI